MQILTDAHLWTSPPPPPPQAYQSTLLTEAALYGFLSIPACYNLNTSSQQHSSMVSDKEMLCLNTNSHPDTAWHYVPNQLAEVAFNQTLPVNTLCMCMVPPS